MFFCDDADLSDGGAEHFAATVREVKTRRVLSLVHFVIF